MTRPRPGKLDSGGAVLAAVGLGGTTYALIEAPEGGVGGVWSPPR